MNITEEQINECARLCHEINRAWCALFGDESQMDWFRAEAWQRGSAVSGVRALLSGVARSPREQHEAWAAEKRRDGWVYGPDKDPIAKTHPCLVDYELLSPMQRAKDHLFIAVVRGYLGDDP